MDSFVSPLVSLHPSSDYGAIPPLSSIGNSTCASLYLDNFNLPAPLNKFFLAASILLVMLLVQTHKKRKALVGNEEAAETLVLGIYRYLFWYMLCITSLCAVVLATYSMYNIDVDGVDVTGDGEYNMPPSLIATMWALNHAGIEGITFLLLQRGVGRAALQRVLVMTIAWSAVTFVVVYAVQHWHNDMDAVYQLGNGSHHVMSIFLAMLYSAVLIVFYGTIVVAPLLFKGENYAHSFIVQRCAQRPALRLYATFWLTYELITAFDVALTWQGLYFPFCIESANRVLLFGIAQPFVVLKTLKDDCLYWQGLYSPGDHSLNAPLMGGHGILRRDSVETLARLDDLSQVEQIHYGMVTFFDRHIFSAGASARVYKGKLYNVQKKCSETVAIKMLFCMELNKTVIDRFASEIQLLNSLSDPNVIRCNGICIMPPALCMITEYCAHGSLYEFLYQTKSRRSFLDLPWNRKISMIIDCIRGVSYLHSKGILHGDIKSLNFLVTAELVVKLGDLGEHRILGTDIDHEGYPVPKNRNWSPPEILSGTYRVADESSDIYSLGMVISEILAGAVPYDEKELRRLSLEDFFLHVYDGRNRPDLSKAGVPMDVIDVVGRTWFTESQMRCTAMDLLTSFLECFQQDRRVLFRKSVEDMEGGVRAHNLPSFCDGSPPGTP
jgi:serine/threonine protein kinase